MTERHGRGNLSDCDDRFADGQERYGSQEECEAAIHPALRRQGYHAAKCATCRGWYISGDV